MPEDSIEKNRCKDRVQQCIDEGDDDGAAIAIRKWLTTPMTERQQKSVLELERKLKDMRRKAKIVAIEAIARKGKDEGNYDGALTAIGEWLKMSITDKQRQSALKLAQDVKNAKKRAEMAAIERQSNAHNNSDMPSGSLR